MIFADKHSCLSTTISKYTKALSLRKMLYKQSSLGTDVKVREDSLPALLGLADVSGDTCLLRATPLQPLC